MCTGRVPFRAETSYGILRRISDNPPRPIREVNAAIPAWLEAIVLKLHAKQPNERFASAQQVAGLLEQCLAHVQQPLASPLPAFCHEQPYRRRTYFATIAAGVLGVAAISAVVTIATINANTPRDAQSSPPDTSNVAAGQPSTESAAPPVEPVSDFAAWNDGIDEHIERIEQSAAELKQDASRDWDDDEPR